MAIGSFGSRFHTIEIEIHSRPVMTIPGSDYPFAQEFITDASGKVCKVIIDVADYQKLLNALEDEWLYRAIMEVRDEAPMSLAEALDELERS
ncbi:hypothetical protein ACKFKF_21655 [Phormidesmis sp. 146-12]